MLSGERGCVSNSPNCSTKKGSFVGSFQRSFHRFISAFLILGTLFSAPIQVLAAEGRSQRSARETREMFAEYLGDEARIRDRERNGVYFVPSHSEPDTVSWRNVLNRLGSWVGREPRPLNQNRVVENSAGFRVSDSNQEQFKEKMNALIEALGTEAVDGHLFQTGLSREEYRNPEVGAYLRATLEELGVTEDQVQIKKIWLPTGQGLRRAWEEFAYFWGQRFDYQKPISAEVVGGLSALFATELSATIYVVQKHDWQIWVPLLTTHLGLLSGITILRRTVENWQNRSLTAVGGYLKQGLLSAMFVSNYSLVIQWQKIRDFIQNNGMEATAREFPSAVVDFVAKNGPLTALQTTFFTAYFVKGVFRFSQVRSATSEGAREVRDSIPWITGLTFFITSPLLIAATGSPGFMATGTPNAGEWGLLTAAGIGLALATHVRRAIAHVTGANGETKEVFVRPTVLDWVSAAVSKVFRFSAEERRNPEGQVCEGAFARLNRFVRWRNPEE